MYPGQRKHSQCHLHNNHDTDNSDTDSDEVPLQLSSNRSRCSNTATGFFGTVGLGFANHLVDCSKHTKRDTLSFANSMSQMITYRHPPAQCAVSESTTKWGSDRQRMKNQHVDMDVGANTDDDTMKPKSRGHIESTSNHRTASWFSNLLQARDSPSVHKAGSPETESVSSPKINLIVFFAAVSLVVIEALLLGWALFIASGLVWSYIVIGLEFLEKGVMCSGYGASPFQQMKCSFVVQFNNITTMILNHVFTDVGKMNSVSAFASMLFSGGSFLFALCRLARRQVLTPVFRLFRKLFLWQVELLIRPAKFVEFVYNSIYHDGIWIERHHPNLAHVFHFLTQTKICGCESLSESYIAMYAFHL